MNIQQNTDILKAEAFSLGFEYVGISKAEYMEEEARRLELWLNKKMHGQMSYMDNHFDMRVDPTKLVEGSKSVITLLYNYYTEAKQEDKSAPKISKYAYGQDYHYVIKQKLKTLLSSLQEKIGAIHGAMFY